MAERHLTVRRQVAASCDSVWDVFADFPNLADHWGGLKASRPIGDQTHGVGARRQVDLAPVGTLVETVTAWEEGRTIATMNQPSALVPVQAGRVQAHPRARWGRDRDHIRLPVCAKGWPNRATDRSSDRHDAEEKLREHAGLHRGGRPQRGLTGSPTAGWCCRSGGRGSRTHKDGLRKRSQQPFVC